MATPASTGSARLRAKARLVSLIGDELISDEPVAIVELVKNAYDADASRVEIEFESTQQGELDNITVRDDGIGMDLNSL